MPLTFRTLPIEGLFLVEPRVFEDERSFFMETFKTSEFRAQGIDPAFLQDNHSLSKKGVLRGLRFQRPPHAQAKLVRVHRGRRVGRCGGLRAGFADLRTLVRPGVERAKPPDVVHP